MFTKLKGYLFVAAGVFITILGIFGAGRKAGIDALKAKNKEETIKTMRKAREIRDAARALSEPAIDSKLRRFKRSK